MRAREFTEPQAAGCIVRAADTGRWCLQQRSDSVTDPGVWSTWGGGRKPGESLEQCVRRELAEESGYTGPLRLEPLLMTSSYATYIGHIPHEFEPQLNSESQDSCWVEAGDWPEPLHPGLAQALAKIKQGVAEGGMKDLHIDLQDQQWDAIVGYVINGLKKNMDIGRIELNLYKYAGQEMFDVDQELQDRGFRDIADLADHIRQHNGRYVPPTDFNLGKGVAEGLLAEETLDDYLMSLKNRGAKIIGRGNNAMVFTNPEDDRTVIKVMHQPDPAYLAYLRQSIKHPNNPWLPRVLDVTSQAFDTANPRSSTTAWIIVLEKLRPASSAEVKNAVDTVLATVDPRYLGRQPVDAYRTFDDIKKLWPTIAQHSSDADIQVVAKFLSQFAPQDIDVSNTNVMMRGLQLVFADPVLS